ncbi:flavodoxin family protein [Pseudovibrio sp. SPO723]|uniref:flavodoxin family protein n=1 Tax=Nesiotobacter zosterae TaxID=392721 RepID=UPI0029C1DF1E|nr:flavodoxin family protein [Pseudovibrio sp. SPO723]MDX5593480.1 flavodoxin family protein [Pseudovibrio sp. SPO723]
MATTAIVYHSGYGHTQRQAEAVRDGAQSVPGAEVLFFHTDEFEGEGADAAWAALDKADAIIFGAPTYMGSASAQMKVFMDKTSGAWMEQRWANKLAAGFTNSGSMSGDKLNTLIGFSLLAAQHGMIWVNLNLMPGNNSSQGSESDLNRVGGFIGAMAQSNVDQGADAMSEADLATAKHLGQRVATMAAKLR